MLSVRELTKEDLPYLVKYWLHSEPAHLVGMGVDLDKLPSEKGLRQMLTTQIELPLKDKSSYCMIWLEDETPIGHSNVNQIIFGKSAFMHLHLWTAPKRQKGMGSTLVKMTLPYFFKELELEELFCEPYVHNPAPNKTLERLGFEFIKTHVTIPGSLNFEQEVNRWRIKAEMVK